MRWLSFLVLWQRSSSLCFSLKREHFNFWYNESNQQRLFEGFLLPKRISWKATMGKRNGKKSFAKVLKDFRRPTEFKRSFMGRLTKGNWNLVVGWIISRKFTFLNEKFRLNGGKKLYGLWLWHFFYQFSKSFFIFVDKDRIRHTLELKLNKSSSRCNDSGSNLLNWLFRVCFLRHIKKVQYESHQILMQLYPRSWIIKEVIKFGLGWLEAERGGHWLGFHSHRLSPDGKHI